MVLTEVGVMRHPDLGQDDPRARAYCCRLVLPRRTVPGVVEVK